MTPMQEKFVAVIEEEAKARPPSFPKGASGDDPWRLCLHLIELLRTEAAAVKEASRIIGDLVDCGCWPQGTEARGFLAKHGEGK